MKVPEDDQLGRLLSLVVVALIGLITWLTLILGVLLLLGRSSGTGVLGAVIMALMTGLGGIVTAKVVRRNGR